MAKFGGKKDPNYSAFYFPGRYWYAAMSFVYDYGGEIAEAEERQVGRRARLGRRRSPGLTAWRKTSLALSRANKTGDEAHPPRRSSSPRASVGSFIANGWEWPTRSTRRPAIRRSTGKIGAFPMPSHTTGKYMPTFLGGSDLAIPVTSKNKALAADWIAAFTSTRRCARWRPTAADPEHDDARAHPRGKPKSRRSPRPRSTAGSCPTTPELGERRERGRAPELLGGILAQPVEDAGSRDRRRAQQDHGDPQRQLSLAHGKRRTAAVLPSPPSRPCVPARRRRRVRRRAAAGAPVPAARAGARS